MCPEIYCIDLLLLLSAKEIKDIPQDTTASVDGRLRDKRMAVCTSEVKYPSEDPGVLLIRASKLVYCT